MTPRRPERAASPKGGHGDSSSPGGTKRAAIYARISQSDPKVDAIADQVRHCTALAEREGYEIVATFSDDGISAYSGKARPGFLDLTDAIKARRFEVILAVAEDRLTRSSAEKIGLQSECAKAGVVWHTLSGGRVDPGTAEGGLLSTITGAIAEYESSLKADRVQRSVARRLAEGKDLGGPRPFGWDADRKTIRPAEAELIRQGVRMVLDDGASIYAVAKAWDASGLKPSGKAAAWRTQTVRHILMRPRNAGRLVVQGVDYGEAFEAIVSPDDHAALVAYLENPARRPRRGPKPSQWTATGLVRCGVCGSYLQQTGIGRQGQRSMRCAGEGRAVPEGTKHPTITAWRLEAQLCQAAAFGVMLAATQGKDLEPDDTAELRGRLLDLIAQRDTQQLLAASPGANVALALKEIARLGDAIDRAQADLDRSLGSNDRHQAMSMARQFTLGIEGGGAALDQDAMIRAFAPYWKDQLNVDRRRALLRGLYSSIEILPHVRGQHWRLRIDGQHPDDLTDTITI